MQRKAKLISELNLKLGLRAVIVIEFFSGITFKRFRFAVKPIRKRGSFEAATPTAKSKATKAVKHNRYDVDTMATLMSVIADQSTDSFIFKAFDLKQAAA